MDILVDSSAWIDYFRSGANAEIMDYLIDENLITTNEIILTELLPFLIVRNEIRVVRLLKTINKQSLKIDWQQISDFQVQCLRAGLSGIGVPDLIIAQNAIQHNTPIYTLDRHFGFMVTADLGIRLYEH